MSRKKDLTLEEIEQRFREIDAKEPEEPTAEDLAAFAEYEAEDLAEMMTLEDFDKEQKEYSGKLSLRIPKELHRQLAQDAKENGVSLNQYALYKLAR